MTDPKVTPLLWYYTECVLYCVDHPSELWADYVVKEDKAQDFKYYFDNNWTPEAAVLDYFGVIDKVLH